MKSKKAKDAAPPKGKAKIKNLKLNKTTIENLSDSHAAGIKGGAMDNSCLPNPIPLPKTLKCNF